MRERLRKPLSAYGLLAVGGTIIALYDLFRKAP